MAKLCYVIDTQDGRRHVAVLGCNCRECVDEVFRRDFDQDSLFTRRKPRAFGIKAEDDREI